MSCYTLFFPHTHLVDGRIVSDQQLAAAQAAAARLARGPARAPAHGPALGAGGGADATGFGLALGPSLPALEQGTLAAPSGRVLQDASIDPLEFRLTPQDPPPVRRLNC